MVPAPPAQRSGQASPPVTPPRFARSVPGSVVSALHLSYGLRAMPTTIMLSNTGPRPTSHFNIVSALAFLAGAGGGVLLSGFGQSPVILGLGVFAGFIASLAPKVASQWER